MKTLKLSHILVLTFFFLGLSAFAQQNPKNKIQTMRIAFISNHIHLTPSQAEKFWPIFNQHEAERKKIREKYKNLVKPKEKIENMSDAEINKILIAQFDMKEQLLALDKQYLLKYKAVISVKQTAQLYKANVDFKRFLLQKLKEHPKGNNPQYQK